MKTKIQLNPEEIMEKRRYERYEMFIPVRFKIFNEDGVAYTKKNVDGFSRNFSKEGMLVEFSSSPDIPSQDSLINTLVRGDILLPIADAPIPFEGEIKWIRTFPSSKIFIGIFISYLDDVHRLKLLQFARRINKRTQAIATLIFTVFFTLSIMLLAFFSFNTYINKIMARQNQINNELNDRVSVLTKKLSEISSQLPKP